MSVARCDPPSAVAQSEPRRGADFSSGLCAYVLLYQTGWGSCIIRFMLALRLPSKQEGSSWSVVVLEQALSFCPETKYLDRVRTGPTLRRVADEQAISARAAGDSSDAVLFCGSLSQNGPKRCSSHWITRPPSQSDKHPCPDLVLLQPCPFGHGVPSDFRQNRCPPVAAAPSLPHALPFAPFADQHTAHNNKQRIAD